jgi:outer membrane receptor protein involved in Fe transport
MKHISFLLLPLILLCLSASVHAVDINGVVRDKRTGELLIGANVFLKNKKSAGTTTGLDGSFKLKNLTSGKHILICSYISYQTIEKEVTIPTDETQKLTLNMVSYENELHDITITSSGKTTDAGVRSMERLSANVVNIVGARSIEISPDLTVANVLGRISGVTLERNSSGEAEYAVLRGMDKRYNITLVNGAKISSPNNKQRFVPLNIFPSELLDRLEVSKTRNAETEGDATGGAVNMVMKDAPSRFTVRANAALGYSAMFFDRDFAAYSRNKSIETAPYEKYGKDYAATMSDFGNAMTAPSHSKALPNVVAGFSIGNRLLNQKLGFIVAANFQNQNKGTITDYFDDEMLQTESSMRLTSIKKRIYSENQKQYGIHAKLDYTLSAGNKIEWYNFLVYNDNAQVRESNSTNFKLSYDPDHGTMDESYQTRLRSTQQYILASTLQGEHELNKRLSLNWTVLYSGAMLKRPDQTTVNIDNLRQNYTDHITIDGDGSERRWEHNSDRDLSAMVNSAYHMPLKNAVMKLKAGAMFRMKNRDNFYVKYTLKPVDTNQSFETIDQINWTVYTPRGSVGPLTYQADEKIGAAYVQARYEKQGIEAIAGLRTEYTDQGYHMSYPNAGEPADGGQSYVDFLPNAQIKYSPTDKTNWRAAYYRSVNRPGYFEIIPYQIQEEEYTEYGNKDLKRTKTDNFDLRWEYFPRQTEQLLIGAFYKNIQSPIEFAYYSINQRQFGYGLKNLGDARNLGMEIDVIKYIRLFGVKANYTFTHSAITTAKVYYGKDEYGNTKTLTANQQRPLVNQAEHVANVSLLFKDVEHGWNAQLAASYTGEKIAIASRFLDSDYWDKPTLQLDASIEKDFKSGLSVFAKANNLLNTPTVSFVKTHNEYNDKFPLQDTGKHETIIRKEYYKPSFLIGIRYKL